MNQVKSDIALWLSGLTWFSIVVLSEVLLFLALRWLSPESVIFTQGLLVITSSLCVLVLGFAYRIRRRKTSVKDPFFVVITLLAALTFYSFLITIPTLLDRSISIFLIAELNSDPNNEMSISDLNSSFIRDYVDGDFQTRKRVAEQIQIGNFVVLDTGEIKLTNRGRFVSKINFFLARVFRVDPRYTDR